jgi:hypothetical protein
MSLILDIFERAGEHYQHHSSKANEVMVNCPFCPESGRSEDTFRKLGINTRLFIAHCHRCDYACKGLRRLVSELCRVYHLDLPTIQYNALAVLKNPVVEPEPVSLPEAEVTGFPEGYETFLFDGKDEIEEMAWTYLKTRGITPAQIGQHRIGYAAWGMYSYRIVLPVIGTDQQIYGYACRGFADQKIRYLNSPGTKLLWGAHRKAKVAIECEGIFSSLAVERAVKDMPGVISVAPLGSATTDTQLVQLEQYESVLLFPDHDKPGIKGCIKRAEKYVRHGLKVYVVIPKKLDEKDPNNLTSEQIRAELDRTTPWTEFTEFKLRMVD